jgi:hypothetical protein
VGQSELDCITSTLDIIKNIDENVIGLPADITDNVGILQILLDNDISLCALPGDIGGAIGSGLESLPDMLNSIKDTLDTLLDTIGGTLTNTTVSINDARTMVREIVTGAAGDKPAGLDTFAMNQDEDGNAYPMVVKTTTDEQGMEQEINEEYTCVSLRCVDNEFDNFDNAVVNADTGEATLPMARTKIFTIANTVAVLGSLLGIAGLVLNKKGYWKLCCLLFLLWGPITLAMSAIVYGPLMLLSDWCGHAPMHCLRALFD